MPLSLQSARPLLAPLLLGTLAACGGTTPSDDLYVTNPVLVSGYVDQLNRPLICNNLTTPMEFDFLYSGNLQSIKVSLVGVNSGTRQGINYTGNDFSGGRGKVTFNLAAGTAPLSVGTGSLRQQSIVVSPNVIGYSELEMQAFSGSGVTRVLTSNAVPVVSNCS
ncbi:hypothetical protein E5F05_02660 (plasmid) [Deinococcus metallilatus]|uniref:Lipoprotein n=1 Tax=Deinococcus metallilatus TaxID=1211322 RepID=A0AAJ5F7L5_9DEIO|nr:hypothetical protein [Deinococcus metallilatus]MBB5295698.1 hypothetical protein [Deinococcus metallilatus]QBY06852.1 hypothetical protein E5F05_02660 [Deinococcus metallilatus]TLK32241.1 hypothetical protein FCS05_01995 [Deinococcus metallilatus]GMA14230.1 hypothetical protein GCM10025871_05610 [Deinococcus metallilatus]